MCCVCEKCGDRFMYVWKLIVQGDLYDHESLVKAIKQVDVVISTVGQFQLADQEKIIAAIKEAGNIKVHHLFSFLKIFEVVSIMHNTHHLCLFDESEVLPIGIRKWCGSHTCSGACEIYIWNKGEDPQKYWGSRHSLHVRVVQLLRRIFAADAGAAGRLRSSSAQGQSSHLRWRKC